MELIKTPKLNNMESNFEKAIRETIEGQVLSHGDYCEVTREQAVELLTIENYKPAEDYVDQFFGDDKWYDQVCILSGEHGIVLSGIKHSRYSKELPFPDFKERLVNTVKV
jgi:hypothetical protein